MSEITDTREHSYLHIVCMSPIRDQRKRLKCQVSTKYFGSFLTENLQLIFCLFRLRLRSSEVKEFKIYHAFATMIWYSIDTTALLTCSSSICDKRKWRIKKQNRHSFIVTTFSLSSSLTFLHCAKIMQKKNLYSDFKPREHGTSDHNFICINFFYTSYLLLHYISYHQSPQWKPFYLNV